MKTHICKSGKNIFKFSRKTLKSFLKPFCSFFQKEINFYEYKIHRFDKNQRGQSKFQKKHIRKIGLLKEKRLIVFLVPPEDYAGGGLMSIFSICITMRKFSDIHNSRVIICTYPREKLNTYYTKFSNNEIVLALDLILGKLNKLEFLCIHVPEVFFEEFYLRLSSKEKKTLRRIPESQINLMKQNSFVPKINVKPLLELFKKSTCTTAHRRYSNVELKTELGFPVHHLSFKNIFAQYESLPYHKKKDILLYSPDYRAEKHVVISFLKQQLSNVEFIEIRDLEYVAYLSLISKAKWTLTFGEGLDAYFIEPIYCGGISFAVYNEAYFTPDYKELPVIFESFEDLMIRLPELIRNYDSPHNYKFINGVMQKKISEQYRDEQYVSNIERFLHGDYSIP